MFYGLFSYPVQPTTVKLLPNYKGLTAINTAFRFCRVGPRVENPTKFISDMAMYFLRVSYKKSDKVKSGSHKAKFLTDWISIFYRYFIENSYCLFVRYP